MSLHEKSESSDGEREREERRPAFSCAEPLRACWLAELAKVRRGILAGRRVVFGDGIVAAGGLYSSSPVCPLRRDCRVGRSGEWRCLFSGLFRSESSSRA